MSAEGAVYRIGKRFRFEATRRRDDRTWDGNSFIAEAVLSSPTLGPEGFVADFGELGPLGRYIDRALDHRILDEVVEDVSDEGIAAHLTRWASAHLPADVAGVLESIRVRTGRPSAPPAGAFVSFAASHRLRGLRPDHPCGRLHGHSYVLTVPGSGTGRRGEVPVLLRTHVRYAVHGRVLNEAFPGLNPTSENLARHFAHWLADRAVGTARGIGPCVRVSETETSWAQYTGSTS